MQEYEKRELGPAQSQNADFHHVETEHQVNVQSQPPTKGQSGQRFMILTFA